jgi:hypothetical protein
MPSSLLTWSLRLVHIEANDFSKSQENFDSEEVGVFYTPPEAKIDKPITTYISHHIQKQHAWINLSRTTVAVC